MQAQKGDHVLLILNHFINVIYDVETPAETTKIFGSLPIMELSYHMISKIIWGFAAFIKFYHIYLLLGSLTRMLFNQNKASLSQEYEQDYAIFIYKLPLQKLEYGLDIFFIMFTSETQGSHTDYILQECHERQFQLSLQAHQEAERLKNKIISTAKQAINEEFKKKQREAILHQRIYMNVLNNQHKLQRLKARYQLCEQIYQEVQVRLKSFATAQATSADYKIFLIGSIVEGLIRMYEDQVDIRCLESDKPLIQGLLPDIREIYNSFMVNNIGFQHPLHIKIATNFTLQQRDPQDGPLSKNKEDRVSVGGVILADKTGNITYKATLDSRLNVFKEICLPLIREIIWSNKQQAKQTNNQVAN